jgi:8-oxo-dGTP pyrophosphatase MutT (NUDIX family)
VEGPVDGAAIRLPRMMAGRALDVLAGRRPAAAARDAATVMLLRPAPTARDDAPAEDGGCRAGHGLEVYMLRRKSSMAFAPGAFVFPGGSVDSRDADEEVAWTGPDVADWGAIFDAPGRLARALVCAAVRETFEESGVLLAGPSATTVVADTSGDDWEADRHALLDRSISLAEMLGRRRLVLRADLLKPWSRWITPVVEERRFDARFFAAALPPGQRTRDVGGEAAQVAWIRPADAIAAGRKKEIVLWLPTAVTLGELAACGTMAAALASPRQVTPLLPEVTMHEGTPWLSVPGERGYPL